MAKTEFISAASLPEATGDEVSVLCVENGALKQKAAKGLGGGGIIIMFDADNYEVTTLPEGLYNTLDEMLNDFVMTSNINVYSYENNEYFTGIRIRLFNSLHKNEDTIVIECQHWNVYVYPDGSATVEFVE